MHWDSWQCSPPQKQNKAKKNITTNNLGLLFSLVHIYLSLPFVIMIFAVYFSAQTMGSLRVKVKVQIAQSCLTLCDSMDFTVRGILQARILEVGCHFLPRGSSQPRDWSCVSCITGRYFLPLCHVGSPACKFLKLFYGNQWSSGALWGE